MKSQGLAVPGDRSPLSQGFSSRVGEGLLASDQTRPNLAPTATCEPDANIRSSSSFCSLCAAWLKNQENIKLVLGAEANKLISVTGIKWI